MGRKNPFKVHEALERKRLREAERIFHEQLVQDVAGSLVQRKVAEESAACRTVAMLLALREKGWGKSRADWLINRSYEIEDMVNTGKTTWGELIRKMFDEYGYEEGEFGKNGIKK